MSTDFFTNAFSKVRVIAAFIFFFATSASTFAGTGTHQYGVADIAALKTDLQAGTYEIYELTESGGAYVLNSISTFYITLASNVTIKAAAGLSAKPVVSFTGTSTSSTASIFYTVTPNLTITLDGLEFNGDNVNTAGLDPMLLNATSAATNCSVVINNCYIHHFVHLNGVIKLAGSGANTSVNVQGSTFDRCAERIFHFAYYATADTNGSVYLKNDVFSNFTSAIGSSTSTNGIVYYATSTTGGVNSYALGTTATIDHCTFYNCTIPTSVSTSTTGNFVLKFNTMSGAVSVTNCIFDQVSRTFSCASPIPTIDYCYLAGFTGALTATATNTFATAPVYANAAALDFSLTNASSFLCADATIAGANFKAPITAVNSVSFSQQLIRVRGNLIIAPEIGTIQVFNLQGAELIKSSLVNQVNANLPKGIYVVRFTNNVGKQSAQKIAIQ